MVIAINLFSILLVFHTSASVFTKPKCCYTNHKITLQIYFCDVDVFYYIKKYNTKKLKHMEYLGKTIPYSCGI